MIGKQLISLIDLHFELAPKVDTFAIPRAMTLSELTAIVEA